MSAVGVGLSIGVNALLLGGGVALAGAATGGFGADDAKAVKEGSAADVKDINKGIGVVEDASAASQGGLDPYAQAGADSVAQMRALAGLDGDQAQQAALASMQNDPTFLAAVQQQEQAILANGSATGGLRGGNMQDALANNRSALFGAFLQNRMGQLGQMSGQGQQAATQQGMFGMQGAGGLADLFGQRGAATAGGIIGQQAAWSQGRREAVGLGMNALGIGASLATGGAGGIPMAAAQAAPAAAPPVQQAPTARVF